MLNSKYQNNLIETKQKERKVLKNHEQYEMNRKNRFFTSTLYHLVQNNSNKTNRRSNKFKEVDDIKELNIKKAPIISSPISPSISSASSKVVYSKNRKQDSPSSNYKLPFISAFYSSKDSSSLLTNTVKSSSSYSSVKHAQTSTIDDENYYTSYMCSINDNLKSNSTTKPASKFDNKRNAFLQNRSSKVSFKLDK